MSARGIEDIRIFKFAFCKAASQKTNCAGQVFNFLIFQSCYCIENLKAGGCDKEPYRMDYIKLIVGDI